MTYIAIGLLLVSAFVHAVWNMIGKRENSSPMFFLQASISGGACMLPVVLLHLSNLAGIPRSVWVMLVATGLFQAVYYCGLAGAYRSGHLSIAYPLARSAPVILVAAVSLLIGKEDHIAPRALAGMLLITIGGLTLPVVRLSEWKLRDYLHPASLFALMAAVGTSGYTIIDDSALHVMRNAADPHANRIVLTLTYAFLETVSSALWLCVIILFGRRGEGKSQRISEGFGSAAIAGVGISFAYGLALLAMTFANSVSYIMALRQLSIPIGAALGVIVLREPRYAMKAVGVTIMLTGLVMVAIK